MDRPLPGLVARRGRCTQDDASSPAAVPGSGHSLSPSRGAEAPLPPRASRGAQGSGGAGDSDALVSSSPSQPLPSHPVPWRLLASPPLRSDTCCPSPCLSTWSPLVLTAELGLRHTGNQIPAAPRRGQDLSVLPWGTGTRVTAPGLWLRPRKAGTAAGQPTHRPPCARSVPSGSCGGLATLSRLPLDPSFPHCHPEAQAIPCPTGDHVWPESRALSSGPSPSSGFRDPTGTRRLSGCVQQRAWEGEREKQRCSLLTSGGRP